MRSTTKVEALASTETVRRRTGPLSAHLSASHDSPTTKSTSTILVTSLIFCFPSLCLSARLTARTHRAALARTNLLGARRHRASMPAKSCACRHRPRISAALLRPRARTARPAARSRPKTWQQSRSLRWRRKAVVVCARQRAVGAFIDGMAHRHMAARRGSTHLRSDRANVGAPIGRVAGRASVRMDGHGLQARHELMEEREHLFRGGGVAAVPIPVDELFSTAQYTGRTRAAFGTRQVGRAATKRFNAPVGAASGGGRGLDGPRTTNVWRAMRVTGRGRHAGDAPAQLPLGALVGVEATTELDTRGAVGVSNGW